MLETSVAIRMEQNHNQHDLRHRHFAVTMVVSLFRPGCSMHLGEKRENIFQNSSNLKKNPYNLVFSERRGAFVDFCFVP